MGALAALCGRRYGSPCRSVRGFRIVGGRRCDE
nr:MAG TPA: hypothetical protein [Caudoviricetes sp.]